MVGERKAEHVGCTPAFVRLKNIGYEAAERWQSKLRQPCSPPLGNLATGHCDASLKHDQKNQCEVPFACVLRQMVQDDGAHEGGKRNSCDDEVDE